MPTPAPREGEPATPIVEDPVAPPRPSWFRRALAVAGKLAMLLAFAFLVNRLHGQVAELRALTFDTRTLLHLGSAFAACFLIFFAEIWNWGLLLGGSDPLRFRRVGVVFAYIQVAKYLPGNVLQYVLGVQVGRRIGVPPAQMIPVLVRATLLSIGVGAVLGAFALAQAQRSVREAVGLTKVPGPWIVLGGLVAALALAGIAGVIIRRTALWNKVLSGVRNLPPGATLAVALINVVEFFGYGLCAREIALLWATPDAIIPSLWAFTSGFALAWVAGLVVPGAPGGLGVREAILYGVFSPTMGQPLAVATFIGMRAVLVIAEFVFFLPAPFALRHYERKLSTAPSAEAA